MHACLRACVSFKNDLNNLSLRWRLFWVFILTRATFRRIADRQSVSRFGSRKVTLRHLYVDRFVGCFKAWFVALGMEIPLRSRFWRYNWRHTCRVNCEMAESRVSCLCVQEYDCWRFSLFSDGPPAQVPGGSSPYWATLSDVTSQSGLIIDKNNKWIHK